MAFIEAHGVCKGYGAGATRSEVLRDVELEVERGEFVAVVGYSGAGKTTLVSMLAGLLKPDAGTITMNGEPVTEPAPERGVVFQNYSLLPWLTVFENVALAVDQVFGSRSAAERRAHVERFVALVNLTPARNKRAVGRHAPAGGPRPGARHGAAAVAARRAARCARRADPRHLAERAGTDLPRERRDHHPYHQ
jgi:ABC-type nitrate/sulfonate/bicarbonate transport system ATPase subunit